MNFNSSTLCPWFFLDREAFLRSTLNILNLDTSRHIETLTLESLRVHSFGLVLLKLSIQGYPGSCIQKVEILDSCFKFKIFTRSRMDRTYLRGMGRQWFFQRSSYFLILRSSSEAESGGRRSFVDVATSGAGCSCWMIQPFSQSSYYQSCHCCPQT